MYEVLDKGIMKSEILLQVKAVKRCYVSKKPPGKRYSKHSLPAKKLAVDGRLLLRLHDAVFVGHE